MILKTILLWKQMVIIKLKKISWDHMIVCARGVMVIVVGNEHCDTSSNPGRGSISHSTNTLGKGMNPIFLPSAMGK